MPPPIECPVATLPAILPRMSSRAKKTPHPLTLGPSRRIAPTMTILTIALGGAIGSVLRHLAVTAVSVPWGTALVNVVGSFAMGVLYVLLSSRTSLSPFLVTGILGGFTTFSAFSLDTLKFWEAGQMTQATLYAGASVLLSLTAVAAGVSLTRTLA